MKFIALTNSDLDKGIVHVRADSIYQLQRGTFSLCTGEGDSNMVTTCNATVIDLINDSQLYVTETIEEIYGLLGIAMPTPIKNSPNRQCRSAPLDDRQESSSNLWLHITRPNGDVIQICGKAITHFERKQLMNTIEIHTAGGSIIIEDNDNHWQCLHAVIRSEWYKSV